MSLLGLHLIGTDKPLVKCRKEGTCRACGIRRITDVQLVGGDDPRGFIPLCSHCEDSWSRHELNIGGFLSREEAAFVVGAMGLDEANRFLNPLEFHRAVEVARQEVREAA